MLWGLLELAIAEMEQLDVGNCLLLKALYLITLVACHGGRVVLEHPAPSTEPGRPAIWQAAIMQMLTGPANLFQVTDTEQYLFGGKGVKPTRLMFCNTDLPRWLRMMHAQIE